MPVCTTCTSYTPFLYTVYQSDYNLRLEQCSSCYSFADPYVEHDSLTLLLDLILLKRGVYRHLLYNRGAEPRRLAQGTGTEVSQDTTRSYTSPRNRERERWSLVLWLGSALVMLDAFIRWSYLNSDQPGNLSPWTHETMTRVLRVLLGCCAETLAFHLGIILSCFILLPVISRFQAWHACGTAAPKSAMKREFRFSLIPLTLFYSSLTKLFLLFLLTIWRPIRTPTSYAAEQSDAWNGAFIYNNAIVDALQVFGEAQLDREWVIRNVLGGMSAGFGLRVVLDIHPIFTSIIILIGWRAKTTVANIVSGWVGRDELSSQAWRAYSVP